MVQRQRKLTHSNPIDFLTMRWGAMGRWHRDICRDGQEEAVMWARRLKIAYFLFFG
jgi:hypothetical protein